MKCLVPMPLLRAGSLCLAVLILEETACGYTLSNGSGPGSLTVGVDGYGAFGEVVGGDAEDAVFRPASGGSASGTSFQSAVALGFRGSGERIFLTSGEIGGSGNLASTGVAGGGTFAGSGFSYRSLWIDLNQKLVPLVTDGGQTGTMLVQEYSLRNQGDRVLEFDLIRYLDGDLKFDDLALDGGGWRDSTYGDFPFTTDSAKGGLWDPYLVVGITASGGVAPTSGRFEVGDGIDLRDRILGGQSLLDSVVEDGDGDRIIDAGAQVDVVLALNNQFALDPGASSRYVTRTLFGTGSVPSTVVDPPPPPPPAPLPEGHAAPWPLVLTGLWTLRRFLDRARSRNPR